MPILEAVGTATLVTNAHAESGTHYDGTGRTQIGDPEQRFQLVQDWAASAVPHLHPEAAEFTRRAAVGQVGGALTAYRGIAFARGHVPGRLGPPEKPEHRSDQRYSYAAAPALYLVEAANLVDAQEAILREMKWKLGPDDLVWVQRYHIPADDLRIADYASLGDRDYVNLVFHMAERGEPSEFTRTVARIVSEAGFAGMSVLGVRGGRVGQPVREDGEHDTSFGRETFRYRNLVLFNPYGAWEAWTDGEPFPLDDR
jgi:hypothetical protein